MESVQAKLVTKLRTDRWKARRERERKSKVANEMSRSHVVYEPSVEAWTDRNKRINAPRTVEMLVLGDPIIPVELIKFQAKAF